MILLPPTPLLRTLLFFPIAFLSVAFFLPVPSLLAQQPESESPPLTTLQQQLQELELPLSSVQVQNLYAQLTTPTMREAADTTSFSDSRLDAAIAQLSATDDVDRYRLALALCRRRGDWPLYHAKCEAWQSGESGINATMSWRDLKAWGIAASALGNDALASDLYQRAVALQPPVAERAQLEFRLALHRGAIAQQAENDELIRFTLEHRQFRAPTSHLCAALGNPALAAYFHDAPTSTASPEMERLAFAAQLRRASWFLWSKNYSSARQAAREAARLTPSARDQRYAWSLWVESFRQSGRLDQALQQLATIESPASYPELVLSLRVALLQQLDRPQEALQLLRAQPLETLSSNQRRELLQACRESGRDDLLRQTFTDLIRREPRQLEWREGLSRDFIARGERARAAEVWDSLASESSRTQLVVAQRLANLGLDSSAQEYADRASRDPLLNYEALELKADLARRRGDVDACVQQLDRIESQLADDDPARLQLASYWERLEDFPRAIATLEKLYLHRQGESLSLRLAWLYSESQRTEDALRIYRSVWTHTHSSSRRRFLEERLLKESARLGKLADLAIELEDELLAGTGGKAHRELLVALYVEAGDPISAAEILAEGLQKSRRSAAVSSADSRSLNATEEADILREMARAYDRAGDSANAERMLLRLAALMPSEEKRVLTELLSLALQRGDTASVLAHLDAIVAADTRTAPSPSPQTLEMRAGALLQIGLWEEAAATFQGVLAKHPERSEVSLLLGRLWADHGQVARARQLFQAQALSATNNDTFAVAIDGLLNLATDESAHKSLEWAYRETLLRLINDPNPLTLHHLCVDLSEALDDAERLRWGLQEALPSAGEQRGILLRELCDGAQKPPSAMSASAIDCSLWKIDSPPRSTSNWARCIWS